MTQKFTLHQDAKGVWWETCFSPPVKTVTIQAHSKKQALYCAHNNVIFDPVKRVGILPDKQEEKREPILIDAIRPPKRESEIDITPFDREVLQTQSPDECPCCQRPWEGR